MRHIVWLGFVGGIALAGLACDKASESLTPESTCNESMAGMCRWADRCMTAKGGVKVLNPAYTSVADCTAQSQLVAQCKDRTCPVGTAFSPDKAEACINTVNRLDCAASPGSTPPGCTPAEICQ